METINNNLDIITKEILGENYYNLLYKFFDSFFNKKTSKKTYIAFITRRCSCIAYIFKQIIEKKRSEKTSDDRSSNDNLVFLTDSALINKGWEIGQILCKNNQDSPDIILIDDSISYGRALANVLNQFEKQIKKSIQSVANREVKADVLSSTEEYMQHNISIRIFAEKKQANLLPALFNELLTSEMLVSYQQWNDYSNRLTEVISNVNIANAAFVISAGLNQRIQNQTDWIRIDQDYRDHKQQVYFWPISDRNHYYHAVCSVRCIECSTIERYRFIPFVFLPAMKTEELEKLEEYMFLKLYNAGVVDTDYHEIKIRELQHMTWRSRLEFLTMFLSFSVLQIFVDDNELSDVDMHYDTEKVLWNYFDSEIRVGIIKRIVCNDYRNALFSMQEIRETLQCLSPKGFKSNLSENPQTRKVYTKQNILQGELNEQLETYLFELGIENEKKAREYALSGTRLGEFALKRLHKDRYGSFFDLQNEIMTMLDCTKQNSFSSLQLLASVFQMMDAGLMAIVSEQLLGKDESLEVSHQIRVCEQALCALPRRYYCHSDVIILLEKRRWLTIEDCIKFLEEYCSKLAEKDLISEEEVTAVAENLIHFLGLMGEASQKMTYWTVGLNRHFRIPSPGEGVVLTDQGEKMKTLRKKYESALSDMQR